MRYHLNISGTSLSIVLFYFCAQLISCSEKRKSNQEAVKVEVTDTILMYQKPPATNNDTLLIDTRSAIFFNPDPVQLDKIKEITPPNIFDSNTHDCFFQMRNARMVIKKSWQQLKVIETSTARFLLFKKADNTVTTLDLNAKGDMCGILLFDPAKEPQLVDMTNIDTALRFYFDQ